MWWVVPVPKERGARVCENGTACVEALDADTMTVLKYRSPQEATDAVAVYHGDARQSGWIAVQFKEPGLSDAERDAFMHGLDGVNAHGRD